MNRSVLEAVAELAVRDRLAQEAVAELVARRLEEGFPKVDPLKLRSIASRRHRNKGRFADEVPKLSAPPSRGGTPPAVDPSASLAQRPQKQYEGGQKIPKAHSEERLGKDGLPTDAPRVPVKPGETAPAPEAPSPKVRGRSFSHEELEKLEPEQIIGHGSWESGLVYRARTLMAARVKELDSQRMFKPGGAVNAKGEYEGGKYTAERSQLHRAIIGAFLQGLETHPKGAREVLFMAGGPASGKSTALKNGLATAPDGSVLINPDAIKRLIPEYRFMLALKDPEASSRIHEESGDIAKALAAHAREQGFHVTVDKVKIKPEEAAAFKDAGYKREAVVTTVPIPLAVERADERGKKTGRQVPYDTIVEGHQAVAAGFQEWAEKTGMPMTLVDTSTGRVLAKASGGHVGVVDDAGYELFRSRAFHVR